MDQDWFDMKEYRKRSLNSAVWIPLRASEAIRQGEYGFLGYKENYFGCGSAAFPVDRKADVEKIDWMDLGINQNHGGSMVEGKYYSAEIYHAWRQGDLQGIHLVIDQGNSGKNKGDWHINPDLIVSLGLYREGDVWVHPGDGYVEAMRLLRNPDGSPSRVEIKAEYLKDYLCARGMGLYVTWYRIHDEILEDASHISWYEQGDLEETENCKWEGRVIPIHEGGEPFGSSMAVFKVTRTEVDFEEDVPQISLPADGTGVQSTQFERQFSGRKLHRVSGEIWREEWIEPGENSPRVRQDEVPPTVLFVINAAGKKANATQLISGGQWLWFKPEVIEALLKCRGGVLHWYTRDTGGVGADEHGDVHFGINELGQINVYAKDIGLLPEWQQKIWAGYNIGPEGGVSKELMDSQAVGTPSSTQAPERYLGDALEALNETLYKKYGIQAFRKHDDIANIIKSCHRFRALSFDGLLSLAKDIARLTADSIDKKELQKLLTLPDKEKLGSLKSLEKVLAMSTGDEKAKSLMGPLFGIYDLRLADAHLPAADLKVALGLVKVNRDEPGVFQGFRLIDYTVWTLVQIVKKLNQ